MKTHESRPRYVRAWIELDLVVCSPLHVGSGHPALLKERIPGNRKELRKHLAAEERDSTYRPMTLRKLACEASTGAMVHGRACIPGSTIKGALRAVLSDSLDHEQMKEVFGPDDADRAERDDRRIGRIRFSDSRALLSPDSFAREPPLWDPQRGTAARARVAIDPVTGAAAKHQLTFYEFVPEGSRISFRFECFDISKDAVDAFCRALAELYVIRHGGGAALCAGDLGWAETDDPAPLRVPRPSAPRREPGPRMRWFR